MESSDVSSRAGKVESLSECLPVVCGLPPEIAHATFKGRNALTGEKVDVPIGTTVHFEMVLDYKCDAGYSLNGDQTGDTDFTVTCGQDKQFVNHEQTCETIEYEVR